MGQTNQPYETIKLEPYEKYLRYARGFAEQGDFGKMRYYNQKARKYAGEIDIEDRITLNIKIAHKYYN
jgi:hypothetical protein